MEFYPYGDSLMIFLYKYYRFIRKSDNQGKVKNKVGIRFRILLKNILNLMKLFLDEKIKK